MNRPRQPRHWIHGLIPTLLVVATVIGICRWGGSALAQQPTDVGAQVLTRGPVHEAFAETVTFQPQAGVVVPKAPPEAVEEMPPDQRPEGDNVVWIPGYWAWDDDERNDFLWISGIWRQVPPGRQWISGYWREAGDGYQWVSGYWGDAGAQEVDYLPEPPATLEAGPNSPAPSADQIWVPGAWTWRERYVWRPGYWTVPQAGWIWVPSYYTWAPGGYVMCGGYWDFPVVRRGLLFAPVYFNAGVFGRPGFVYTPATVINLAVFGDHLFVRPRYGHYYFGDYYAASYGGMGFSPWYSVNMRQGYDPIFAHQRWQHRDDRDWEQRMQAGYQHRRDHEDARPPRTWNAEMARGARPGSSVDKAGIVAVSLDQMARNKSNKDLPITLRSVDKQERDKVADRSKQMQQFREQRKELEGKAPTAQADKPARMKLPTSPIAARSGDEPAKAQSPFNRQSGPRRDATGQAGAGGRTPRADGQPAQPLTPRASTGGPNTGALPAQAKSSTPDRREINRRRTVEAAKPLQPGGSQSQPLTPGGPTPATPNRRSGQTAPGQVLSPGGQPAQLNQQQGAGGPPSRSRSRFDTPTNQQQQQQQPSQPAQTPQRRGSVQRNDAASPSPGAAIGQPGGQPQRQFGGGDGRQSTPRQSPQTRGGGPNVDRQPSQRSNRGGRSDKPDDQKNPRDNR